MSEGLPAKFRQWIYANPLDGGPLEARQFEMRELDMPELELGQALVRIKLINVHASTRFRMQAGLTALGQTDLQNYACAEVVRSRDPALSEGSIIACQAGWQEYQVISSADESVGYGPATELVKAVNHTNSQWMYAFRPALVKMWPDEVLMDIFGTSGMTAYFGMRECGPLMPRDRVLVAAASGSVGSLVAQLAKRAGCHVVGLAGGEERCRWVIEATGIEKCLDYRAPDFEEQLRAAFPDGIDVFSDGVGGPLAAKVANVMNHDSRWFAYGTAYDAYNDDPEHQPVRTYDIRKLFVSADAEPMIASKNIKVEAWILHDFYHERLAAEDDLSRYLKNGTLRPTNATVEGFEKLPEAIAKLYRGGSPGKLQIRFG